MLVRRLLAVFGLLLLTVPASAATIAPSLELLIDGQLVATAVAEKDPEGPGWIIDNFTWSQGDEDPNNGGETDVGSISISAYLDPDPSILYAGSVIDFGAPSTFGFAFIQPIAATAAPGVATHTHSSSTTGGGGGTAKVDAVAPPLGISVDGDATPEIAVYSLSTNGGVTWLNAGMDLSPSFVGAAPSDVQGPFNEGPIAGPAGSGSYDSMRVDMSFKMDGANDAYTFNGEATINVPEPSVAALLALGLGGLFAFGSRRR